MIKVSTWLPVQQLQEIHRVKGDISTILWIRRAILNALAEGGRLPATAPRAEAPVIVEEATATTPIPQGTTKEVEAVE